MIRAESDVSPRVGNLCCNHTRPDSLVWLDISGIIPRLSKDGKGRQGKYVTFHLKVNPCGHGGFLGQLLSVNSSLM